MSGEDEPQGEGTPPGDAATWADMSVEQILAAADAPADPALTAPLSVQQGVAQRLGAATAGPVSGRTVYSIDDPFAQVLGWVRQGTGRQVGTLPTWLRIWRQDTAKGVLLVLHGARIGDEAEMVVVVERGSLSRAALKAAAYWAFVVIGLNRIVARVPNDREDLKRLAQRAGFDHEGVARDGFGPDLDASVWAMRARSCRWLSQGRLPSLERDFGPISSLKVH